MQPFGEPAAQLSFQIINQATPPADSSIPTQTSHLHLSVWTSLTSATHYIYTFHSSGEGSKRSYYMQKILEDYLRRKGDMASLHGKSPKSMLKKSQLTVESLSLCNVTTTTCRPSLLDYLNILWSVVITIYVAAITL